MSRTILNDHPYSQDEIGYLQARGLFQDVENNLKQFPPNSPVKDVSPDDDSPVQLDQDIFEYVKGLSVEQVQAELKEKGLPITGEENQLKVALAQHLQKEKDANTNA
jgi:hypothetical protein